MLNTNDDIFAGQWKTLRKKAKQNWMSLTEDDIKRVDGNADVLIDLLRERYGYTEDKARDEVLQFVHTYTVPDSVRT